MKEQIIQLPDNFEIKEIKDNKIILVKKEKKLTYEDIAERLFPIGNYHFYINSGSCIERAANYQNSYRLENITTSRKQAEKLLAINKLMNVSKYLNGDWQPDWSNITELKYYLLIKDDKIVIDCVCEMCCNNVYFKSEELAKQAIEILGEETIKLALCTDY